MYNTGTLQLWIIYKQVYNTGIHRIYKWVYNTDIHRKYKWVYNTDIHREYKWVYNTGISMQPGRHNPGRNDTSQQCSNHSLLLTVSYIICDHIKYT